MHFQASQCTPLFQVLAQGAVADSGLTKGGFMTTYINVECACALHNFPAVGISRVSCAHVIRSLEPHERLSIFAHARCGGPYANERGFPQKPMKPPWIRHWVVCGEYMWPETMAQRADEAHARIKISTCA